MENESCDLKEFSLGEPALVVRWKLKNRTLPLQNRHLRALSDCVVNGKHVTSQLVAWAKQHLEWTLESGAIDHPDGVLMLVVDKDGQAVMSTGPYEPLAFLNVRALADRALASQSNILNGGVPSEILWATSGETIICGAQESDFKSGMTSLVLDLIKTLNMNVSFDDMLAEQIKDGVVYDEVFLSSDEYCIVEDAIGNHEVADRIKQHVQKLF